MVKKILISEEEKSRILNLHETFKSNTLLEQEEVLQSEFIRAIQRFLNEKMKANLFVDGKSDKNMKSNTAKAIANYQTKIGADVDGVWGPDTWSKMPSDDKVKLKDYIAEEGGILDEFINWIKKLI